MNYLKLSVFLFLGIGVLFSLALFSLKILFYNDPNDRLITLGPDNSKVISKPNNKRGLKIPNLDIEILNNKQALVENETIRPVQVKPELLPIEINEEKKIENKVVNKSQSITSNDIKKTYTKTLDFTGFYRVQFGSFRNLNKAKSALNNMNIKYKNLLSKVNLEIFSYEVKKGLLFHRVWTTPVTKVTGLKLCDKFKLKSIVCILQINK